jgi:hypothetical protein
MDALRYRFWIFLGKHDPDPVRGMCWVIRAGRMLDRMYPADATE